jgi:starch synthase
MLAAENGGLPQGKVGGLGDVIRDLPLALARQGHRVTVLTPAYGRFARLPGVERLDSFAVPFAGMTETVEWLSVPAPADGVEYQLLHHPRFTPRGEEKIYHDDGAAAPFATDAGKFAFFCAAAAALYARAEPAPDVVHLHDWHTGLYLLLRECDRRFAALRQIRTVFTIHNLALQGIRPLAASDSSLLRWFPGLDFPPHLVVDRRYPDCVNPLAVGIRLADCVTTVSPTYAAEILEPNDDESGRRGGEHLEFWLAERHRHGSLIGILNGCEYPGPRRSRTGFKRLLELLRGQVLRWVSATRLVDSAAYLAEKRLREWPGKRPRVVLTSVGRVNEQKLGLMKQATDDSSTALDRILESLGDGVLIMLGSGDPEYEQFFVEAMGRHSNLLFLKGYSDAVSAALYASGDLFLMPSVFEPCGISQMLAMRAGQPCVAHAVGGLKDTVSPENGFPFEGDTPRHQAQNFAREVAAAIDLKLSKPERWRALTSAAAAARFSWDDSAQRYLREVYSIDAA